jgi:hypothetical protein
MTTHYLDLLPHEALAMSQGRLGVIVRLFDNPPPDDMSPTLFRGPEMYHPTLVDDDGEMDAGPAVFGIYDELGEWGCASPFGPPGTVLHCREDYGDSWHHAQPQCFYKATDFDKVDWHPDFDGWEPADTMPDDFIRHRPTVGEVTCKRVEDLTFGEWVNAGWLTSIYEAKPITRTNELLREKWDGIHGPGSWERNPWLWLCTINPHTT